MRKVLLIFSDSLDTYGIVVLRLRDSAPWVRLELEEVLSTGLDLDFFRAFSNVQLSYPQAPRADFRCLCSFSLASVSEQIVSARWNEVLVTPSLWTKAGLSNLNQPQAAHLSARS